MKYTQASHGRTFIAKIEDSEDLLKELKEIIIKENIKSGMIHLLGAITETSAVLGPKEKTYPPDPYYHNFDDAKEVIGLAIFAWKDGEPKIHLHGGIGNSKDSFIGCIREKSKVYITIEAIIQELISDGFCRKYDERYEANLIDF